MEPLADLSLDLRWTWHHGGDYLWRSIDADAWEQTQNPWWILQTVPESRTNQLAKDHQFMEEIERLKSAAEIYHNTPGWFGEKHEKQSLNTVAYFSLEFGLGEALPLYAGGLGILAGDYLKTASDLNVPIVGIGLLYQEGYFRQILSSDGWQTEAYPHNDPTNLPIRPVMDTSGGWLKVPLELPGRIMELRVWQVQVGRVMLYLLDSNYPMNSPADRGLIYKLYDDNPEFRIIQEMALGIAGWRVLKALNIPTEICHLNEGHAAFLVLERARAFMAESGQPFPVALWATRAGNIFTTHTSVAAGFDTFSPELITKYLGSMAKSLGLNAEELLALGRLDPDDQKEPFNMATLAMRGSIMANAVSKLHGEVSRKIFQPLFPRWPVKEVPLGSITNGVHIPSWDSANADALWTNIGGHGYWRGDIEHLQKTILSFSDAQIWELSNNQRRDFVSHVRQRLALQLKSYGADPREVEDAEHVFDTNCLTIGFARRFTEYKRPNLLLHDQERFLRILNRPEYPVQLVVAGKAHPKDLEGKQLIKEFVDFSHKPECHSRVVFLPDYDIAIAQELVQGVDLWINTPRRPWEACGTSGMKVLVNGGLNLSEIEGWWAEAYTPEVGWAIGDGQEHNHDPKYDATEANQLYDLLEKEIIPEFYDRDASGLPTKWISRIRASMSRLTPNFSSNRMLRDYVENMYLPGTEKFRKRIDKKARLANDLYQWQRQITKNWDKVHFGKVTVSSTPGELIFEAQCYIGDLPPDSIAVEIYADKFGESGYMRHSLELKDKLPGSIGGYLYHESLSTTRPAEHFTLRIIPFHSEAMVPFEENKITWQMR
jgi:glycogen phosphorylase